MLQRFGCGGLRTRSASSPAFATSWVSRPAAHYLCVLTPGTVHFNTKAPPAWRQQCPAGRNKLIALASKYIFPVLATIFAAAALRRIIRTGNRSDPAARIWLIIGVIFAAVGTWLWLTI
jgi:hypothetical protein